MREIELMDALVEMASASMWRDESIEGHIAGCVRSGGETYYSAKPP